MKKTYRICVLGNSAVDCIILAKNELKKLYQHVEIVCAFIPLSGIEDSLIIDGKLYPRSERDKHFFHMTSGGLDYIDLRTFDACILAGMWRFPEYRLIQEYRNLKYSKLALKTALDDYILMSPGFVLAEKIRAIFSMPILLIPTPFAAHPEPLPIDNCSGREEVFKLIEEIFKEKGFESIAQPEITMENTVYTKMEYCLHGSKGRKFDPGVSLRHGYTHMSADFAILLMDDSLRKLGILEESYFQVAVRKVTSFLKMRFFKKNCDAAVKVDG